MGALPRAHRRWRVLLLAALPGAPLVTHRRQRRHRRPAPGDAGTLSVQPSELTALDRHEGDQVADEPGRRDRSRAARAHGRHPDARDDQARLRLGRDVRRQLQGCPPTSPSVTGRDLAGTSAAEQRYDGYISQTEDRSSQSARRRRARRQGRAFVPHRLRRRVGCVPANRIGDVVALPGVVAVQQDKLEQLLTDSSPTFIGATSLYPQLGGNTQAGQGVIIGVLDSGVWPEHPSFADQGNLPAPPPRRDGTPRTATSATTR